MHLVKAVVTANFTLGEQGLRREALDERYINLLGGNCNRWTEPSPAQLMRLKKAY